MRGVDDTQLLRNTTIWDVELDKKKGEHLVIAQCVKGCVNHKYFEFAAFFKQRTSKPKKYHQIFS